MRTGLVIIIAGMLGLGGAAVAIAQDQGCDYEGRRYEEGATVCQAGLQQNCVNGIWQSLDGERCGVGEDQEELPSGNLEVLPQGGFAED